VAEIVAKRKWVDGPYHMSPAASHAAAVQAPMAYPAMTCGGVWYPSATRSQGRTLVNFPAQPEPFLT